MSKNVEVDTDGLPLSVVGAWALDKHARLRRYIEASRGARSQYPDRAYIDLFAGAGRSMIRNTRQLIDGSPLVAVKAAAAGGSPFSQIILGDANEEYCDALRVRLAGYPVHVLHGKAEDTVEQAIAMLAPRGLHFSFLDPFNLETLRFSVIERLCSVLRMDLLLHVSVMDLRRNLEQFVDGARDLDGFAPGWRDCVDPVQRKDLLFMAIFHFWRARVRSLGTQPSDVIEAIENSTNAELYWLVFVARHPLAHRLWKAVSSLDGQQNLL